MELDPVAIREWLKQQDIDDVVTLIVGSEMRQVPVGALVTIMDPPPVQPTARAILRGEALPFARGSDTSRAAAESMSEYAGVIRERVWKFIKSRGAYGATSDEVEEALDVPHQTISARINELENRDRLIDSGQRRRTRSDRDARVMVTLDAWLDEEVPPPT